MSRRKTVQNLTGFQSWLFSPDHTKRLWQIGHSTEALGVSKPVLLVDLAGDKCQNPKPQRQNWSAETIMPVYSPSRNEASFTVDHAILSMAEEKFNPIASAPSVVRRAVMFP